ncbi:MAG: hypothetical protein R3C19_15160 [Planctomycetaceae bacterium]
MKTPAVSVVLFAIAALLGAIGQYLYKSGAESAQGSVMSYVVNPRLAGGVICYVAVMVLFVAAFRKGGSLTVLYPIYASTFIWAALVAWRAYGTPIRMVNVAGMLLMIAGMYLMGKS